jgi:hypothetical protein
VEVSLSVTSFFHPNHCCSPYFTPFVTAERHVSNSSRKNVKIMNALVYTRGPLNTRCPASLQRPNAVVE